MQRVAIVGTGNVGFHLSRHLQSVGKAPVAIISRTTERAQQMISNLSLNTQAFSLHNVGDLSCDLVILAVPDHQIVEVSSFIPISKEITIVHTSGSQSIDLLDLFPNNGVFYLFQTFSKQKTVDFTRIPIYLEGNSTKTLTSLRELAQNFSSNVKVVSSEQRLTIHLAAVFASNFTNHLYVIAEKILRETGVEFSDFQHLIKETVEKAMTMPPEKAQTGPAIRGDQEVIDKHLELLKTQPEWKKIYQLISEQIGLQRET